MTTNTNNLEAMAIAMEANVNGSFAAVSRKDWFIKLSEGNKKLVPSKDVKFLIWSLPAIITCPGSTAMCRKSCYALKAERCYPSVKAARNRNFELSKLDTFVARMTLSIAAYVNKKSYAAAKKVIVRIHESGDFYDREYMAKWFDIASRVKAIYGDKVQFMAYTKSVSFMAGLEIPSNMTVRFSRWADTPAAQLEAAAAYKLPVYTAVESFDGFAGGKCHCEDCGSCGMCWNARAALIACEIH